MLSFLRGTCIDVVLFAVLRGNITWIIKHLGSTWEGLGWWVTLTPSELKIYQVIRHQGRNETWTIFSTCLGNSSCFVIILLVLFYTYVILHWKWVSNFLFSIRYFCHKEKTFNEHAFFSGGQKSRVAFADLALSNPDVIVLVSILTRKTLQNDSLQLNDLN